MKDQNCSARTRLCCIQSVHSGKSIESQRDESSGERRHGEKKVHSNDYGNGGDDDDEKRHTNIRRPKKRFKIKPHLLKYFKRT